MTTTIGKAIKSRSGRLWIHYTNDYGLDVRLTVEDAARSFLEIHMFSTGLPYYIDYSGETPIDEGVYMRLTIG